MKQETITRVNGVEITTVEKDGAVFVPVKPVCEALTLDFSAQLKAIKRHRILNSVVVIMTTTGSDGKQYEMACLPLKYVYGWLFNIELNMIAEEKRDAVERYQRECYEVLYDHFQTRIRMVSELAEEEASLLRWKLKAKQSLTDSRNETRDIDRRLEELQNARINPQPTLF